MAAASCTTSAADCTTAAASSTSAAAFSTTATASFTTDAAAASPGEESPIGYCGLYSLKKTLLSPSCRSSAAVLGRRASRTLYAKYDATARMSVTTMEMKMTVARMLTQSNLMTLTFRRHGRQR